MTASGGVTGRKVVNRNLRKVIVASRLRFPGNVGFRRVVLSLMGLLCALVVLPAGAARADNPVVQTIYTA
ncbi:hypothetical protein ACFFWE_16480, partial [Sphaerisporangium melleum]